jgi:hypothetical protein
VVNSHMKPELEGSKQAFAELQSKFAKQHQFCKGVKNCNVVLCNERNEAIASIKDLE